jgi:hypothetical protein
MSAFAPRVSDDGLAAGFWGGLLAGFALVSLVLWWLVAPIPVVASADDGLSPRVGAPIDAVPPTPRQPGADATTRAPAGDRAAVAQAQPPVGPNVEHEMNSIDLPEAADPGSTDEAPLPTTPDGYPRVAPAADVSVDVDPADDQDRWVPLWQPFRSPVSAHGFAERLALMTGFEFEVVSEGADRHRVGVRVPFGSAEADVLGDIEAGTGLDVGRFR